MEPRTVFGAIEVGLLKGRPDGGAEGRRVPSRTGPAVALKDGMVGKAVGELAAQGAENRREAVVERYLSLGVALGREADLRLGSDAQRGRLEVDVGPVKRGELAVPEAGHCGGDEQGPQSVVCDLEEVIEFFGGE